MDTSLTEGFAREDITAALGEPLVQVLDMNTWRDGADLASLYDSLHQVVNDSVERERRNRNPVRELVFRRLGSGEDRFAPTSAGLYQMTAEEIAATHTGLLFNGATECCDGT